MADTTKTPPFFHALAVFVCKRNRLYRVHVRSDELVFIWAGAGSEGLAGARKFGPVLSAAIEPILDSSNKNAARRRVLDKTPLEDLIGDDPRNMRAPLSGFTEVRIAERSDHHARVYSDHRHQALLFLRHANLGKYLLGIESVNDVQIAMRELPRVLGHVYRAEIEVPEDEKLCGCVFCR